MYYIVHVTKQSNHTIPSHTELSHPSSIHLGWSILSISIHLTKHYQKWVSHHSSTLTRCEMQNSTKSASRHTVRARRQELCIRQLPLRVRLKHRCGCSDLTSARHGSMACNANASTIMLVVNGSQAHNRRWRTVWQWGQQPARTSGKTRLWQATI
jgi:hypothetical protein